MIEPRMFKMLNMDSKWSELFDRVTLPKARELQEIASVQVSVPGALPASWRHAASALR